MAYVGLGSRWQEERMREDPRTNVDGGGRAGDGAPGRPVTRRDFLSAGAAAGVAFYLTACGSGGGSSSTAPSKGPVTLNNLFMQQAGYSPQDLAAMTKAFESANPKITVNNTLVPYDSLHTKIVAGA